MSSSKSKETWNSNYKHREYYKSKRKHKDSEYLSLGVTPLLCLSDADLVKPEDVKVCLTAMDSKTEIPFKRGVYEGEVFIVPAYWPKELYVYWDI